MIFTLHGQTTHYNNIVHDIRIAKEAGFDALEVMTEKLFRYLSVGLTAENLIPIFRQHAIQPVCIDFLGDIERANPAEHRHILEEAEQLCVIANTLNCPTIQLNPFNSLQGRPLDEIQRITARNIADIADIGQQYGMRFQVEGTLWSPLRSLAQSLDMLDAVDRENVGLVLDFWHVWASGESTPDELAMFDASSIYAVHVCDGIRGNPGEEWPDETVLRAFLLGEGQIPLREWAAAVQATGFDGVWSVKLLSPRHWEMDPLDIARKMRRQMECLFPAYGERGADAVSQMT